MSFWQKLLAVWFTLLLTLTPLVWLSNTSELFEFNKLITTYIFTILILATWAIRCIAEKRLIFRRTPLDIPLILFLGSCFLSLIFSIDRHTSWFGYYSRWNGGVLSLLAYAALYWSYVSNMSYKSNRQLLNWMLGSAALVAAYAGLEHFGWSPSCVFTTGKWDVACWVQDVQTRVFGTLGQPNWLGAYITALIFIPMSAAITNFQFTISKQFSKSQILNFLIFVLLFVVLLFTKSRSGLLAFAIGTCVLLGLNFLKIKKIGNYLVIGIWLLVIATLSFSVGNPIRDLVIKSQTVVPVGPSLEVGGTESGAIRKIVWTGALRIWQASPKNFLFGTGPETFAESYYQYRPQEHNLTSEWELLYNKAHNEFLNYLATMGMLGLLSYLGLLMVMGWTFFQYLSPNPSPNSTTENRLTRGDVGEGQRSGVRYALFAGWLTISVTNFWGFSVVIMQILLFILPAMGHMLNAQDEIPKKSDLSGTKMLGAIGVLLIASYLLFLTGRYWFADTKYANGQNLMRHYAATQKSDYLLASYEALQASYTINKSEPTIISEFGVAAAYLASAMRSTNATSAAQLATLSLQAEDAAIAISPRHPNFYKSAAKAAILLSDLEPKYLTLAFTYLQQAAKISPTDPRILFNMGVIAQYQGDNTKAKNLFEASLKLKPDFADPIVKLKELK